MNKVILKGRLTNKPQTKNITDEMSVTRFSIAVDRKYKKDEETKADFINIVAWNKTGEFIEKFFDKGQEILIIGRLETSHYIDKDSQKKLTSYNVVVEEVEFVGKKEQKEDKDFEFEINEDNYIDDLPF